MNGSFLKLLACVTMLCDHIGYTMQFKGMGAPEISEILRIIGRISFPLFAFLLAEGFKHTKSVARYAGRLLIAAIISEIPYDLCFHGMRRHDGLNIMFTLLTALLALQFYEMCVKSSSKELIWISLAPIAGACFLAESMQMDYGFYGILLIFLFYLLDTGNKAKKILIIPSSFIFSARYYIDAYVKNTFITSWGKSALFAMIAAVPLILYNGKKGTAARSKVISKLVQYLFYLFYPAHLFIIYLLTR